MTIIGNITRTLVTAHFIALLGIALSSGVEASPPRPNVILIMTDDQGYGEIAAHGNPIIKTPQLDKLHAESLRFTDFHVDPTYSAHYLEAGLSVTMAIFYGMITCIDDNLGRLRQRLAELDLAEDTLLIFMTDNGTTAGWITYRSKEPYYNAGMRGWKSSAYEGGHRVPLFWHWPKGGLAQGRDIPKLSAHIDVLPTLVDLLALRKPVGPPLDGMSLAPLLRDPVATLRERTLFVHVQRQHLPPKWINSATMTSRWRLIDGKELYDIQADPGQQTDLAASQPETVAHLRAEYEAWWKSMESDMQQTVRYAIGGDENPLTISAHDWLVPPGERDAIWNQGQIKRGEIANGPWAIDVEKAGTYEISLHRWPPYLEKPMGMTAARLRVGDLIESRPLGEDATKATFKIELPAGPTTIKTWLQNPGPERAEQGAYYLHVRHLGEGH